MCNVSTHSFSAGVEINQQWPLVSVIVPVHNAARFLVESIESVLRQNYSPIELIAIDDGSSDQSLEILRQYGTKIRLLTQSNLGPAAARNKGIEAAKGNFIAFQDADDLWLPGKLRAQMAYLLSNPEIGIVFGQFAFWRPAVDGNYPDPNRFLTQSEEWEIEKPLSGWIYAEELEDSQIAMITPLIRREVFESTGRFDESLQGGSDYDFWLRATYTTQCHKLPQCVALYRLHRSNLTIKPRRVNYPYIVLQRAINRHGVVGPDGRSVAPSLVEQRLARSAFDFSILHMERGNIPLAIRSSATYLRHAGITPTTSWKLLTGLTRSLAKRAKHKVLSSKEPKTLNDSGIST